MFSGGLVLCVRSSETGHFLTAPFWGLGQWSTQWVLSFKSLHFSINFINKNLQNILFHTYLLWYMFIFLSFCQHTIFDCKFVAKHHGNNNELEQTSFIWSYCIVRSPLPQLYQRIMVSPWVVINTPWPLRSPSERLKVCRTCLFFCLAMSFY